MAASVRILLVEDDVDLAELISDYLVQFNFTVFIETRGDTGMSRIMQDNPDLVVLDLMLPGMDGLSVCRGVRSTYNGPILMLTAREDDVDQVVGLEIGADDYVKKPVEPRVLLARIRLEQDLMRFPEQQWPDHMKTLQPRFGYELKLMADTDVPLDVQQKDRLRQGRIVVIGDGELLYKQLGESRMVLRKGPMSALGPEFTFDTVIHWSTLALWMTLPSVFWVVPLWRKLRKISATARAFGDGDFNVRVDIGKRSSLAPIANAFNAMADRIQQLISSHKELTNAVSHELRSPIARIRFGLEMQQSSSAPEKKQHYARGADIRCEHSG